MVKIYDVARKAGVSLATVSRVINSPDKVKEKTRTKVQTVIKELGYKPNAIAQGLASRKSTTIAVVVPNIMRSSVAELLDGICKVAYEFGYKVVLFALESTNESVSDVLKSVFATHCDGIIYINDFIDQEEVRMLEECGIPVVLTNSLYPGASLPSATIDYVQAAYDATRTLYQEGRRDIIMVSSKSKHFINTFKEKGYMLAMKDFGLEPRIVKTSSNVTKGYEEAKEYVQENNFDGVIGVRDSQAITFVNAITNFTNKKIPTDVSIIGFQNTWLSLLSNPQLSCIDASIYDLGTNAMELLTKLMKNEEVENHAVITQHGFALRGTTLSK